MPRTVIGGSALLGSTQIARYWGGGAILWVGNRSGLPAGDGTDFDRPLSAVFGSGGALDRLNAKTNTGAVILVLPGHAENVSAADAGSLQGAANSFAIVGLGGNRTRPTFTWSAAAATWLLDTSDIQLDNLRLLMAGPAGTTAITVAAPMTISGDGCAIRNCYIQTGIDNDQLSTTSITVTGDDCVIEDNFIIGNSAALQTDCILLTGADNCIIRRNYIAAAQATNTAGLIRSVTTASTNVQILFNYIEATGTGNQTNIDFSAALACSGNIEGNLCRNQVDANLNFITHNAANLLSVGGVPGNYGINNVNERGIIEGTASV